MMRDPRQTEVEAAALTWRPDEGGAPQGLCGRLWGPKGRHYNLDWSRENSIDGAIQSGESKTQ